MFLLKPIGFVLHEFDDEHVRRSTSGVRGEIHVLDEYIEGLEGLEDFSHLMLIAWLHKVPEEGRKVLKVKPRRFVRLGVPEEEVPLVGVFACDSPYRPNPIAITIVRLLEISGSKLVVEGLDLYSGTPVLDIRPYAYGRVVKDFSVPNWYEQLWRRAFAGGSPP